jgi:hypothetical protein
MKIKNRKIIIIKKSNNLDQDKNVIMKIKNRKIIIVSYLCITLEDSVTNLEDSR